MKNLFIFLLLGMFFISSVSAVTCYGGMSGDGTSASPCLITNWTTMNATRLNLSAYYSLTVNLSSATSDYAGIGNDWQPIGNYSKTFYGVFSGNENTISDLIINKPDTSYVGLFGAFGPNVNIYNLGLKNASITGNEYVGGFVGSMGGGSLNFGFIINSYFQGNVNGSYGSGILTGYTPKGIQLVNSYYNIDNSTLNGNTHIGRRGIYDSQFNEWLNNNKSLLLDDYFSKSGDYYLLNNVSDLKNFLAFSDEDGMLDSNSTLFGTKLYYEVCNSSSFKLNNSIDLINDSQFYIPFLCVKEFNGNGYNISNLNLNYSNMDGIALFGTFKSSTSSTSGGNTISNLNVLNVSIISNNSYYVSAVVGHSYGHINMSNVSSSGTISGGAYYVGGLAGVFYSSGYGNGVVNNCHSSININVSNITSPAGPTIAGGLIGLLGGTNASISNSYATGNVIGTSYVGGLVGNSDLGGRISNSYATGNVIGTSYVGGLLGFTSASPISNSYATGNVIGTSYVGGLVGYSTLLQLNYVSNIINSYATGNVIGSTYVGGLAGFISHVTVNNSYSIGNVNGSTSVGGLIGTSVLSNVSNSFWDVNTSGKTTSAAGTGKTTQEMRTLLTFNSWNISMHEGSRSYPYLAWQAENNSYVWLINYSSNLTSCDYLDVPNAVYTLQNDIFTPGTCFTFSANNITLNLNGFSIVGDGTGYGVYFTGQNEKVLNGQISNFTSDVKAVSSLNNTLTNVTYSTEAVDASSSLTRKWYVQVNVLDPPVVVPDANVVVEDSKGDIFESITNYLGLTKLFDLISYINNGGVKETITHEVTATRNGFSSSALFNVTANDILFVYGDFDNVTNVDNITSYVSVDKNNLTLGESATFSINLFNNNSNSDYSTGFYQTQYAGWVFTDEDGNIIESREFEQINNSYQENVTITPELGNYNLTAFIIQYNQTYDENTGNWTTSNETIIVQEYASISVTEEVKVIPAPPAISLPSIRSWFLKIWDFIVNAVNTLFGLN